MKLAIMQPYFFPYIGYFQLIAAVDLFIVYDNIQYTKKGWINRNRMLQNGKDVTFSLPIKKASDYLDVCQRELSPAFSGTKMLNQFAGAYRRAPYFKQTLPLIEQVLEYDEDNLFRFLLHSISKSCEHLGITTEIRVSSEVTIDHGLRGQDKVLALCEAVGANQYINPIGGQELYSKDAFKAHGIELQFIKSKPFEYQQFDNELVPWLSIVDVLMFNSVDAVRERIASNFNLI